MLFWSPADKVLPQKSSALEAVLLLQQKPAGDHGVDSGGVKAADGVAGGADEGVAEEVEGGVVEDGELGFLAPGVEEAVEEGVFGLFDGVDADEAWHVLMRTAPQGAAADAETRVGLTIDCLSLPPTRRMRVQLRGRQFGLDLIAGVLTEDGETVATARADRDALHAAQLRAFAEDAPELADAAAALRTVATIEAIERAAAARTWETP